MHAGRAGLSSQERGEHRLERQCFFLRSFLIDKLWRPDEQVDRTPIIGKVHRKNKKDDAASSRKSDLGETNKSRRRQRSLKNNRVPPKRAKKRWETELSQPKSGVLSPSRPRAPRHCRPLRKRFRIDGSPALSPPHDGRAPAPTRKHGSPSTGSRRQTAALRQRRNVPSRRVG